MNVPLSDETLAKKAQTDIQFFEPLVERYEQKLLFYIRRISSLSLEETEEVLQEVFINAWRNINSYNDGLKFSSWIYRIAHNQTISSFRKTQTRGQDTQVELDESLFLTEKTDFVAEFDASMSSKNIARVLQALPEKYREILVLKFLEEKSYDEISDILKKPSGTIATLIHRAKESFRATAETLTINFDIA